MPLARPSFISIRSARCFPFPRTWNNSSLKVDGLAISMRRCAKISNRWYRSIASNSWHRKKAPCSYSRHLSTPLPNWPRPMNTGLGLRVLQRNSTLLLPWISATSAWDRTHQFFWTIAAMLRSRASCVFAGRSPARTTIGLKLRRISNHSPVFWASFPMAGHSQGRRLPRVIIVTPPFLARAANSPDTFPRCPTPPCPNPMNFNPSSPS